MVHQFECSRAAATLALPLACGLYLALAHTRRRPRLALVCACLARDELGHTYEGAQRISCSSSQRAAASASADAAEIQRVGSSQSRDLGMNSCKLVIRKSRLAVLQQRVMSVPARIMWVTLTQLEHLMHLADFLDDGHLMDLFAGELARRLVASDEARQWQCVSVCWPVQWFCTTVVMALQLSICEALGLSRWLTALLCTETCLVSEAIQLCLVNLAAALRHRGIGNARLEVSVMKNCSALLSPPILTFATLANHWQALQLAQVRRCFGMLRQSRFGCLLCCQTGMKEAVPGTSCCKTVDCNCHVVRCYTSTACGRFTVLACLGHLLQCVSAAILLPHLLRSAPQCAHGMPLTSLCLQIFAKSFELTGGSCRCLSICRLRRS